MESKIQFSLDIDPSKGGLDTKLNALAGSSTYIVQEDELVIAKQGARMESLIGTCSGYYASGLIGDMKVLLFAHIDSDTSQRQLLKKLNNISLGLRQNRVRICDSKLDISPYTPLENARILRRELRPEQEIPVPQGSLERLVKFGEQGIEIEFRTKEKQIRRRFSLR